MNEKKLTIRDYCFIGIFTAVITICAQISIPMPYGVPMTLQTFVIPLAGMVLGIKKGTLSVLVYVILGAIGVPVFAGMTGGMAVLLGKTGGFILSFPLLALTAGIGEKRANKLWLTLWLVIGAVVNFICGMLMFSLVTASSLFVSFVYVVLPFIPVAIIKIIILITFGKVIKEKIIKSGISI